MYSEHIGRPRPPFSTCRDVSSAPVVLFNMFVELCDSTDVSPDSHNITYTSIIKSRLQRPKFKQGLALRVPRASSYELHQHGASCRGPQSRSSERACAKSFEASAAASCQQNTHTTVPYPEVLLLLHNFPRILVFLRHVFMYCQPCPAICPFPPQLRHMPPTS